MKNQKLKNKIVIYGGGWSGLTAALEVSQNPNNEVFLYESSNKFGGKVSGNVSEVGKASTHAIRLISEYYPSFFDVLSQIPIPEKKGETLMDRLSMIEFFYFRLELKGNRFYKITRNTNENLKGTFQIFKWAITIYKISFLDVFRIGRALRKFKALDKKELQDLNNKKIIDHLIDNKLSKKAIDFILNLTGITVAARPDSSAHMGMDLLYKMFIGVKRVSLIEKKQFKKGKNWIIDGPMEERLIPPFITELKRRGVNLSLNSPLKAIIPNENNKGHGLAVMANGEVIEADAYIIALNNKVMDAVGIGKKDKNGDTIPLKNEWSSGAIVPLKKVPKPFNDLNLKSVFATINSPWAIVGVIMAHKKDGGLWHNDVVFSEDAHCYLEIVVSRFDAPGFNGKTFFECTPAEVKRELLIQVGINDEDLLSELIPKMNLGDNISYSDITDKRTSAAHGPVNKDGKHWVLNAPIYTVNPSSQPLEIKTEFKNIFRAGESVKFDEQIIYTPTLELATETSKKAIEYATEFLSISTNQ